MLYPIELKAVGAYEDNTRQLNRYIDWLEQYYIPNRISIIQPVLICKKDYPLSDELKSNLNNCGLRFNSVSLAYQSRLGPVKWLGPNLSEVLPSLSSKRAMIYPISFCIDNSETDFELAIEYKHIADDNKFSYYKVVKAPNDSDEFISFIAQNI